MSKTPQIFFGGDGSTFFRVNHLHVKNFAQLVDEILNVPAVINVSRKRYQELQKKERNALKQVAYVVPAYFDGETSRRLHEEAKGISLLCLDIDKPELARPYFSNPETLEDQLHGISFALYTTASSTDEEPKIRLIVPAKEIKLDDYRRAIRSLAHMIGLVTVTKESMVPVQAMFLPSIFKGDDPDFDHPLLHFNKNGRVFAPGDMLKDKELTKVGKDERPKSRRKDTAATALEYLQSPMEEVTLKVAENTLSHLDPDLTYPEWLDVAFAMRHQFPGDQEQDAFEIFDAWSAKGDKYTTTEDVHAKWKSIKPHAVGRAPVTARSLIYKAQEAGWPGDGVIKQCFENTEAWINMAEVDSRRLLKEGLIRIAATPLQSPAEEESLLNMIIDRCKKEFKLKVSLTTLRKELKGTKTSMRFKKQEKESVLPWAKGLCYVAEANEFFRQSTGEKMNPESVDNRYGRFLLSSGDADKEEVLNGDTADAARPVVRVRDYLLNILKIPEVYTYLYDPRNPNDSRIATRNGVKYVNTYTRSYPESKPKKAAEAGEIFMRHLRNLIAEEEYIQVVMDFMAHQVQSPGSKIRWAILLQGVQGCGKTVLAEALAAVLGKSHVKYVDASVLLSSQFNDWAYGAQIVALEEIRVAGKNRYEVMNKLKPCISNDTISLNEKFESVKTVDNTSNYMMFTNHKDSLALTNTDRRYFVLQSPLQQKTQLRRAMPGNYFKKLFGMLKKNAGGLRAFFEDWEISDTFDPDGHAPETVYLNELVDLSAPADTTAIREILKDADNPLCSKNIVLTKILEDILEVEGVLRIAPNRLARILDEEGFVKVGRQRLAGERYNIWLARDLALKKLQVLEVARQYLENEIGRDELDLL